MKRLTRASAAILLGIAACVVMVVLIIVRLVTMPKGAFNDALTAEAWRESWGFAKNNTAAWFAEHLRALGRRFGIGVPPDV